MSAVIENIIPSFELIEGQSYYISGDGIYVYHGVQNNSTGHKHFHDTDQTSHRFKPDGIYVTHEKDIVISSSQVRGGERVHMLPSAERLHNVLRIISRPAEIHLSPTDADKVRKSFAYKMALLSPERLGEFIHTIKSNFQGGLTNTALIPVSLLLSYHLKCLPAEAMDYLGLCVVRSKYWPEKLPLLPTHKVNMMAVVNRRKAGREFSPDFIASLRDGEHAVSSPAVVSFLPSPTTPAFAIVHPEVTPVPSVPQPVPTVSAPRPKPRAAASSVKKFIHPHGVKKDDPFTTESRFYQQIIDSLDDPFKIRMVKCSVGVLTQGEMIDLSKLLFATNPLALNNIAFSKMKENSQEKWDSARVIKHYSRLLELLFAKMRVDNQLYASDIGAARELYGKIKKSLPFPQFLFSNLSAVAPSTPLVLVGHRTEALADPTATNATTNADSLLETRTADHIATSAVTEVHEAMTLPANDLVTVQHEANDDQSKSTRIGKIEDVIEAAQPPAVLKDNPPPLKDDVALKQGLIRTPGLEAVFRLAAKAAKAYDAPIILTGEPGVGKSAIARYIHDESARSKAPFRVLDLSQLVSTLFEDQLFGHERGSFTGATVLRRSIFEEAESGTVFLDEIGTLSSELQPRLLRVAESKIVRRIGSNQDISVNVRIITATNSSLTDMVANGQFRADLYDRLNVIRIDVPPLRDRKEDILALSALFLQKASRVDRLPLKTLSADAQQALINHSWPGNARGLENALRRATILADANVITADDLHLEKMERVKGIEPS